MNTGSPGETIPFIDDSGSSSCASSLVGDDPRHRHAKQNFCCYDDDDEDEDDANSLNRLLDDAASRELSFNGFHDDLTSFSCGYVSLDGYSDASISGATPATHDEEEEEEENSVASGFHEEHSSSSTHSSPPRSHRTSHSSIKSSDALGDYDDGEGEVRAPPSLPPPLPPCATCEVSSYCTSNSSSASALSCTTCAIESDPPAPVQQDSPEEEQDFKKKGSLILDEDSPDGEKKPLSAQSSISSVIKVSKDSPRDSLRLPIVSFSPDITVSVTEEGKTVVPLTPVILNGSIANGGQTPQIMYPLYQEVATPLSTDVPSPLDASTPLSTSSSGVNPAVPHHYISSLRVSSMRGVADMGGALVARVATFLRSQYKSSVGSPVLIPWCPRFKLLLNEFETSLVQIPLAPHHKVPPRPAIISSILAPQVQMSFNESVVEDKPRRVLVEGEAGYCNANICFRMAYDWALSPQEPYMSGFSLVFILTLRDFRGGSLFSYMCKEILPRHILSREAMNTLWTHLRKIEEKVLFLLIGYDELCEEEIGDLNDLIEGLTFPSASVILTSRSGSRKNLPSSLHRRFLITGLNHQQTTTFMQKYFTTLGHPDCHTELPRCPIMCLAFGVLYEDFGGKLPSRLTDLFMALVKHMTRKNLQRRGEPMCYGVLPDKYIRLFQDFGKLSLDGLKQNNPYFTGSDLKTKVQHGGEIIYDLTSPTLTFRNTSGIMILRYLVGILGRNAYVVFNIVSQMGISHRLFFLLLKESGMSQMNVIEVCKHVAGREHVVVATNSVELEDWGRLLYSPDCSLEGVEVLLDFDPSLRERHESFFTSLSFNESVKSIKLTCLIGVEFGESEVTRLVSFVRAVLTKRRLESFEMVVTSLEESNVGERLSPVVDMICDTLPDHAQTLERLVIAMELDGEQVIRLCSVLESTTQVKVLHLPHLACGLKGLEAVAKLVHNNPLVSLNLSGSLSTGTPIDDRSTWPGTNYLSPPKEENGNLSFWSFTDAKGVSRSVFNSLPRSFYLSLPRRARLNSANSDKRDSSSLLQKATSFPPPKCCPEQHASGFHQIFSAFKSSSCRVCHLNISKCTLSAEDLVCLGEMIKESKSLSSLRMEGLSRMAELMPVLIALQDNRSLQLLDLTSPHILLDDSAFQVTINAFKRNKSLRFLVLNGWTMQLESEKSLEDFLNFLSSTDLQHLDLSGGQVKITDLEGRLSKLSRQDDVTTVLQEGVPPFCNSSISFLNLDNFEVHINQVTLRGYQIFFLLRNFPKLVDLSLGSNLGADVIDDSTVQKIFALLPSAFPCLRRISLAGWVFSLDNCEKAIKEKLANKELELETKGLSYQSIKSLRQALTEGGRCDFVFEGGPSALYRVRKRERKENMLGKWACINTMDRFSSYS
ncbi:NLR family CARD domain-containing protein 4 [Armadillidium nasatum]|uniref:NLR family CARD domain-containing protein 4 n=1 Tax=Armadillidium nasatum TaxID=96803 RepID=A0A5N5T239_9CRUS|nr:NLR family CARD domain-containing protein 4 [Armadillidium nasatum]